jgi:hypothetical protein
MQQELRQHAACPRKVGDKLKIINKDGRTPAYDVASGLGQALIASGVAEIYVPSTPARFPQTTWRAAEGFRGQDYVEAPRIFYSCGSCGNRGQMEGPTCEKTQTFSHCGTSEEVPADIRRDFRRMREAWEKTHKVRGATALERQNMFFDLHSSENFRKGR